MPDITDALSAIDAAIGECLACGGSLGTSPAADFCSEPCQAAWSGREAGTEKVEDRGAAPNVDVPEVAPVRTLTWLGPAPAGALLKPGHDVLDAVVADLAR